MASDDGTLIKIAVFGLAMSVVCTAMITVMLSSTSSGDYDFDEVQSYREELSSFTGDSMLSSTPWVLQHVYTPWISSDGVEGHVDDDNWLYGSSIAYSDIGKSANIKLDPGQKSAVPITVSEGQTYDFERVDGVTWWADENKWYSSITKPVGEFFGLDPNKYSEEVATVWNYSGYRYVFDPTLPFTGEDTATVRDGALSIVWYSYNAGNGTQEGLSGGLDIYGGDVLLASYSAVDIIEGYNSTSGYATSYDFNFEGTHLTLHVRFDPEVIEAGTSLMSAWTAGDWSMSISSLSVGNFIDIQNSTSYTATGGAMVSTFIQIYTMQLPNIDNEWMNIILWLLVGLPFTLSLALITLRIMGAVKVI